MRRIAPGFPPSRGQALVEFALVFPLFLILVFGLIDIGRAVFINSAISQGAREGARYGSVQARAQDATARSALASMTATRLTAVPDPVVTVTCVDGAGNLRTTCVTNNILKVEVQTTVSLLTPVISQLVGPRTLSASASVAVNN